MPESPASLDALIRQLALLAREHPEDPFWRERLDLARRIRALRREDCPPRAASPLAKAGYASRAQVQQASDDDLRDLPGMGRFNFPAVRAWAPTLTTPPPPSPQGHPWWLSP